MPQRYSGIKELRKTHTRRMRNLDIKTDMRKTVKSFVKALEDNAAEAEKLLPVVYKKMDKAAKRNIFHKNTAARRKALYASMLAKSKAK